MNQFGDLYSQYYDLLYQDKDYSAEADYIDSLIKDHSQHVKTILDLGCGTGKHDVLLCDKGYTVHGVDISKEMLEVAESRRKDKKDRLTFSQSDITQLHLNQKFDTVVSLFHVMSYQNTNAALDKVFTNVRDHLNEDGLFIFDFWYGPAVLTDLPKTTIKRLENKHIKVTRIAESKLQAQLNTVDVNFNIFVTQKEDGTSIEKKELHTMRYFFDTELEMLCEKYRFGIEAKYGWLGNKNPDFDTWNVVWVLTKENK
jgi:SAM-dependent methyltransferase